MQTHIKITSGFVSVIGRANAGKSTLLNSLIATPLALVSRKAHATRKRMDFIVPFQNEMFDSQIIFIDTPGLHESTKLLNQYMINEANKAIGDSDLCLFIAVASMNKKEIGCYEQFIDKYKKKHIVLLNKIDCLTQNELLECLNHYKKYQDSMLSIIPLSANNLDEQSKNTLLFEIAKNLPEHAHFYDDEIMSTTMMREIYKEAIRESLFERLSDEIPYESDVEILKITEKPQLLFIKAQIIVEKDSQKSMVIGKNGNTIKSLGTIARKKCQRIYQGKVFLELHVKTMRGWSKTQENLKKIGYNMHS